MSDKAVVFPLIEARKYLTERGVGLDDMSIEMAEEISKRDHRGVRKGYLISHLDAHGLLDEFIDNHWPNARSKVGENNLRRYQRLKEQNDLLINEESENYAEIGDNSEVLFELEFQLRDFIAHNLSSIKVQGKKLKLYVDASGRNGIEYPTAVGPIDILAIDDNGEFVAFELKRANSADKAIGQLARYMGWLRQTIGKDSPVNGVIVAKEISENLRYAVCVVPNVSLFEYEVSFSLKPVEGAIQ